jgi:hypothetical protein
LNRGGRRGPLSSARLLTIEEGETRVTEFPRASDLLSELGITAADLWLAEDVLWVEGASEVEVARVLAPDLPTEVAIRAMPDASRFSSASTQQAEATFRFCREVVEAVTPLPVRMLFLFDRDEKSTELLEEIRRASGGKARFLDVRELENLFLDAELIEMALRERAEFLGIEAASTDHIRDALDTLLELHEDRALFPRALDAEETPRDFVRGSEVLRRLYWETTTSKYDKVRDGKRLAELAVNDKPELLEPLRTVIEELVARA